MNSYSLTICLLCAVRNMEHVAAGYLIVFVVVVLKDFYLLHGTSLDHQAILYLLIPRRPF